MKTLILLLFPILVFSQTPNLLGKIKISDLQLSPYREWYQKGYENYIPNEKIIVELKKLNKNNLTLKIFMGTWCGDTKRELPKFIKIAFQAGFEENQIEIIAVNNEPSKLKQSPNFEEKELNIYRVATFIVLKKGKELNRIIEYPISTLERDLLLICQEKPYKPNYSSFAILNDWQKQGILSDQNVSIRGLANVLKNLVKSESEMNAMAYVLIAQKNIKEAITVLNINLSLYPNSPNCYDSLAEAYLTNNQKDLAIKYYKIALDLDKNNMDLKNLIQNLETKKD